MIAEIAVLIDDLMARPVAFKADADFIHLVSDAVEDEFEIRREIDVEKLAVVAVILHPRHIVEGVFIEGERDLRLGVGGEEAEIGVAHLFLRDLPGRGVLAVLIKRGRDDRRGRGAAFLVLDVRGFAAR